MCQHVIHSQRLGAGAGPDLVFGNTRPQHKLQIEEHESTTEVLRRVIHVQRLGVRTRLACISCDARPMQVLQLRRTRSSGKKTSAVRVELAFFAGSGPDLLFSDASPAHELQK